MARKEGSGRKANDKRVSRRKFLADAGSCAASIVATTVLGAVVTSDANAECSGISGSTAPSPPLGTPTDPATRTTKVTIRFSAQQQQDLRALLGAAAPTEITVYTRDLGDLIAFGGTVLN